ncbi:hypothetical protein [Sphingomonas sp.]|jgi:hypothetical protein|uniref:hypothetical protein n=1 Tax=Sphingomonas sp. TaxID=28214 RepID=UPI0026123FB3|nr:hypothetical protein [Sphingomonas sp.]MDF2493676.1 hypothetical protein [Sphingomonas sp.]
MSRTFPVLAIASLGALIASLVAGFLLASWVFTGIVPAHAAPPLIAGLDTQGVPGTNSWHEAGYDRIGLWEQPRAADLYAAGSSKL